MAWLQLQSQFYLETKFLFHQNCLFHYKALRSMTRIPLVPVYPSFLFIFQEEKIIAEIKKWNSKYCILISDSCFQCLYADRKFWSRRYLFPHLCIRISDNTGYPDREFFFLIQEERDSFKELIAKKDQLNRMQRSVAKTFQEVLELTGSLCFMFRSTPTIWRDNRAFNFLLLFWQSLVFFVSWTPGEESCRSFEIIVLKFLIF